MSSQVLWVSSSASGDQNETSIYSDTLFSRKVLIKLFDAMTSFVKSSSLELLDYYLKFLINNSNIFQPNKKECHRVFQIEI